MCSFSFRQSQVDRLGTAADTGVSAAPSSGGGGIGSLANWFTAIPQAIGAAAVAAIKFVTPTAGHQHATDKIDYGHSPPNSGLSYSEVQPFVDLNAIAFGVLGVAALGTVGYGYYAAVNSAKKRRRIGTRSAPSADAEDLLLLKLGQALISGRTAVYLPLRGRERLTIWEGG